MKREDITEKAFYLAKSGIHVSGKSLQRSGVPEKDAKDYCRWLYGGTLAANLVNSVLHRTKNESPEYEKKQDQKRRDRKKKKLSRRNGRA